MNRWQISSSVVLALSLILMAASTASAQLGFQPISPDELKMTSEPKAPGADAIYLFREVDRDESWITTHEDHYYRIKILTEEGRKYANVEVPYLKNFFNIIKVHARTIRSDGSIADFDGKVFDKTIVKARGVKYQAKTFTMPDVAAGGIIEYFYSIDFPQGWVFDSHWVVSDELFTKSARFTLKPSKRATMHLRMKYRLPTGVVPVIEKNNNVHLDVSDIPAFHVEDYMPPAEELKERVDFIYTDSYETDPDKYWKQFGKVRYEWMENFIAKPKAMEQAVSEIVSPADPPEVKLEKIYARVQKLRNMSYEKEKTEEEKKREKEKWPANAEEVWKWQRGSYIDLTWLFAALVRAAGIQAYGVWIADRYDYFFDPKTMDENRLKSNAVLVKLNGKDMYFEPGTVFEPFGILAWGVTGMSAYKLDKDGGGWIKTPLYESGESRTERKAELKLTEDGDLEGKLKVTFTGQESSLRRIDERFDDETARKKFLEDEVKEWIPGAAVVELTNQPDWQSSSPLVAEFSLKVPGWSSAAGRRALVPSALFGATEKHLFEHEQREHPVYFDFAFQHLDDVTIELPAGWQILDVPAPQKMDANVISYAADAENNKGTLALHRSLNVEVMMLDKNYYPALRDFFQKVSTADEQPAVLQPANSAASN